MPTTLRLDPDRLLPAEPSTRAVARGLYELVREAPIISPHGHVDAHLLLDDAAFADPAELFIRHDHYVTRMLHAAGVPLDRLGVGEAHNVRGRGAVADPREIWRLFCLNWHRFAGTASGFWLASTLAELFEITVQPAAETADEIYDAIAATLATSAFRPRALFDRFGIEALATTDDPLDDLEAHVALAADPTFAGRVLPTFRPDAYVDPSAPGWADRVDSLLGGASMSYRGYLMALEDRRRFFIERGAVSADHGVEQPMTLELEHGAAERLFQRALAGRADEQDRAAFAAHMLVESARMSVDDGLVMTVHAGVLRNHHSETAARFGPDTGHDIPVRTEFTRNLRPLLQRFGTDPRLHLVLFTVDETAYSRDIAPLAGFYPSVLVGAPWWFLDAPDAVLRFREAVTETAGFYRGSGFIDDTRAFLSIPARHDMSRRLDAAFLARLVSEGRLDLAIAERIALDLVDTIPRNAFRLPPRAASTGVTGTERGAADDAALPDRELLLPGEASRP